MFLSLATVAHDEISLTCCWVIKLAQCFGLEGGVGTARIDAVARVRPRP